MQRTSFKFLVFWEVQWLRGVRGVEDLFPPPVLLIGRAPYNRAVGVVCCYPLSSPLHCYNSQIAFRYGPRRFVYGAVL